MQLVAVHSTVTVCKSRLASRNLQRKEKANRQSFNAGIPSVCSGRLPSLPDLFRAWKTIRIQDDTAGRRTNPAGIVLQHRSLPK